jgi:tellurite resistance protein TehA-like permease
MATGIVSAALQQAGLPWPSGVLLGLAAAALTILLARSGWRAAAFHDGRAAGLGRPDRAFASFALVAACGVLASRLATAGAVGVAGVLAAVTVAAWPILTWLVPVRVARHPGRVAIADVNGTWYLWAVATESLAIVAAFPPQASGLGARLSVFVAIVAWAGGLGLYLVITALLVARIVIAGIGPAQIRAPYWVAMGVPSISVFAATRIVRITGAPAIAAARPVIISLAILFWTLATALIPLLAMLTARTTVRRPFPGRWPRYRPEAWTVVFPLGMYAMASLELGRAAGVPLIHGLGTAAVWPATAAWALVATTMAASPFRHHQTAVANSIVVR